MTSSFDSIPRYVIPGRITPVESNNAAHHFIGSACTGDTISCDGCFPCKYTLWKRSAGL
jgi:hypothetical protein